MTGEGDSAAVEKERQKLLLLSMQKEKEMRAQEEELRAQKKELETRMEELEGKLKKSELEAKTAKKLKKLFILQGRILSEIEKRNPGLVDEASKECRIPQKTLESIKKLTSGLGGGSQ